MSSPDRRRQHSRHRTRAAASGQRGCRHWIGLGHCSTSSAGCRDSSRPSEAPWIADPRRSFTSRRMCRASTPTFASPMSLGARTSTPSAGGHRAEGQRPSRGSRRTVGLTMPPRPINRSCSPSPGDGRRSNEPQQRSYGIPNRRHRREERRPRRGGMRPVIPDARTKAGGDSGNGEPPPYVGGQAESTTTTFGRRCLRRVARPSQPLR
jgi:hypothetical protein